ncbi:glucose 1-dehydrogenase [Paenibacillus sp. MZ04-78.2]|uniref:SDR family NAD(P)-dependent oxidoreductase n=1 Tax=Paenibacillus sp. MZ04-78.2 TaxID=2962034 RepID=UPI0020B8BE86|nr:glucose 1-dehydrogenase [Paenibacillus sp. MZ04-78.2]MCP3772767.1 glucose 1-dehydrogenase [Paenibacillus sp. MZ04-78.2]
MKLADKVAIVTGAGSGNGRAIALRLFAEGAAVVVADMNEAGAQETIALAPEGSKAMFVKVDVTKKAEVEDMVSQTIQKLGKIDILVNNAGIVAFTPFLELGEEEWDRVHNVNLKGPFLCSQAVAKQMIQAGRGGRIVNITSVEAHRVVSSSGSCQPHYNSSKGGLHMLTKATALELSSHGITVNSVAPGVVQTPFTEKGLANPEVKKWLLERLPAGRVAQPQDVANAVVFLASDDSNYITGSTIVVDGGWTIH